MTAAIFPGTWEKALDAADYAGFEARRAAAAERGMLRGIGYSNTVKKTSSPFPESGGIRFDPSGTVTLIMGTISHGQGHETVFKQIVCDRLGLDPDTIRYVQGDTDIVTYGRGTFNSALDVDRRIRGVARLRQDDRKGDADRRPTCSKPPKPISRSRTASSRSAAPTGPCRSWMSPPPRSSPRACRPRSNPG